MADLVYGFSNRIVTGALRAFSTWRVEGAEAVPPGGPLIVVSNHLSNMDPPLLACSIPRRLSFIAKKGLFLPGLATFLRAYGAFPMNRDGHDVEAFRWARKALGQGAALVFFPEAHRHPVAGLQRPVPGIALLAVRTQVPVLPVAITGTERLGSPLRVVFPTGNITVRIGSPFTLPAVKARLGRAEVGSLADAVMSRVAALLPEEYRGVYSDPPG